MTTKQTPKQTTTPKWSPRTLRAGMFFISSDGVVYLVREASDCDQGYLGVPGGDQSARFAIKTGEVWDDWFFVDKKVTKVYLLPGSQEVAKKVWAERNKALSKAMHLAAMGTPADRAALLLSIPKA